VIGWLQAIRRAIKFAKFLQTIDRAVPDERARRA
jgi:hypothetical protein